MKKWIVWIGGIVLVLGLLVGWYFRGGIRLFLISRSQPSLPPAVSYEDVKNTSTPPVKPAPAEPKPPEPLNSPPPSMVQSINLAVPFASQAPLGEWDAVHEETCEEASSLMVDAFFDGRSLADTKATERELQELIAWQKEHFGYFESTTAAETATMIREYYGYKQVAVTYDISIKDIKKTVLSGFPVIIPAYGRGLGNPNFKAPGPLYHMLVVRGVTKTGDIITNDPGTRRGEGYVYDPKIFFDAIHDWNGGDVEHGRKVMIVIQPNE